MSYCYKLFKTKIYYFLLTYVRKNENEKFYRKITALYEFKLSVTDNKN